jgi:hypothetical protein
MGYALAYGYPVYVIGRRENTLQYHPQVTGFPTIDGFLDSLVDRDPATQVTGGVT